MKKKVVSFGLVLFMALVMFLPVQIVRADQNIILSLSQSSVNIGDQVTVTIKLPVTGAVETSLNYDNSGFEFVSSSDGISPSGNSGKIANIVLDGTSSFTFKAKTSGSFKFVANGGTGLDINRNEVSFGAAGGTVTVANEAANNGGNTDNGNNTNTNIDTTSADNSLRTLTLSAGTLSPDFKYNVTNYSATVDYNVTNVAISAECSNKNATIESVTGNDNLEVGDNTVSIVVKAGNGTKATYKITITRKSEAESGGSTQPSETDNTPVDTGANVSEFEVNGNVFIPVKELPTENTIPDFSANTIMFGGEAYGCLKFDNGDLTVIYMAQKDATENVGYFVYDIERELCYPFVKINSETSYMMVLVPSQIPSGLEEVSLTLDGKGQITAYKLASANVGSSVFGPLTVHAAEVDQDSFYYIYGMNNRGESGWYKYDTQEGTFQRTADFGNTASADDLNAAQSQLRELQEKLASAKATNRYMIIGLIMGIAIFVVIIVNLVLAYRDLKKGDIDEDMEAQDDIEDIFDESDDEDEEDEDDEKEKKGFLGLFKKKDDDFWAESEDEDDDDEEEILAKEIAEKVEAEEDSFNETEEVAEEVEETEEESNEDEFAELKALIEEEAKKDSEKADTDTFNFDFSEVDAVSDNMDTASFIESLSAELDAQLNEEVAEIKKEAETEKTDEGIVEKGVAEEGTVEETMLEANEAEEEINDATTEATKNVVSRETLDDAWSKMVEEVTPKAAPQPEVVEDFMDAIVNETMAEMKASWKNEEKVEMEKAPAKSVKPSEVEDEGDDDLEFLDL